MKVLKPNALAHGDTIGVVAPAGPVDRQRIDRAFDRLRQRGFRIKTYGDIYRRTGYLAGDDATRAQEFITAFEDPETAGVWCARGGYGVVRLLERIDFDCIRRHPKAFVGFSDITALHIAIQQRAGLMTFHGPNLQDGFGNTDDMPAANEAALWRALIREQQSTTDPGYDFNFPGLEFHELRPISAGKASGRLIGGNLAVLAGLIGTPFEAVTTGRILFLEDVGERLYRIDRYLAQLTLSGKLRSVAGVLLGSFSYDEGEQAESDSDVANLLGEYLGNLGVPVLAGVPAGHTTYNLTLPMGARAEIDVDNRRVKVLEAAVAL